MSKKVEEKKVEEKAEETKVEETKVEEKVEETKVEKKKVDVKRVWRAKCRCQMPWRDFEANETVELLDSEVTPRVKALFECLTPEQAKAAEDAKKVDPELKVMIDRLKAAKIPVKRGATKEEIKKLFDEFLANSTAGEVSENVK